MLLTDEDRADDLILSIADMFQDCAIVIVRSKESTTNVDTIVYVDSEGNDQSVTIYGYYYYTMRYSDTLDSVAAKLLHNPDMGTILAYYNGIEQEADIPPGTRIKIPRFSSDDIAGNAIYAPPGDIDTYGRDIKIGADGGIALEGADTATIKGSDNLNQGIAMRLATAANKRLRLVSYGIRNAIGDPMAISSYLRGTIEQTISANPRIAEVNGITFRGSGDSLYINIEYTDINGTKATTQTSI